VERFEYLKESDSWRCPDDRKLVQKRKQAVKGRPPLRCYECPDCGGCRLRAYCLKSGEERRTLLVKKRQLIKAEMRARLKDPGKRAIYGKRKWVVEQGIGQIKAGMGFREVSVRGKKFARSQWYLICAVYNIMKMVRCIARMRKGGLVPAMS